MLGVDVAAMCSKQTVSMQVTRAHLCKQRRRPCCTGCGGMTSPNSSPYDGTMHIHGRSVSKTCRKGSSQLPTATMQTQCSIYTQLPKVQYVELVYPLLSSIGTGEVQHPYKRLLMMDRWHLNKVEGGKCYSQKAIRRGPCCKSGEFKLRQFTSGVGHLRGKSESLMRLLCLSWDQ
jgi:hypothetical protein